MPQLTLKIQPKPRNYEKAIVSHSWGNNPTQDEHRSGNVYIWTRNYDRSVESYLGMYAEALKAFPDLKIGDCECLFVSKSRWCRGVPVLKFHALPDLKIDGYENRENHLHDMIVE